MAYQQKPSEPGMSLPSNMGQNGREMPSQVSSVSKESACNAGDLGSIPGSGRSPGEGNGNPLRILPVLGLHCCMDFLLGVVSRATPCCGVWASH